MKGTKEKKEENKEKEEEERGEKKEEKKANGEKTKVEEEAKGKEAEEEKSEEGAKEKTKKEIKEDSEKKEEKAEEDEEEVLKENIKQFLKSAELVHGTNDFTSATILYFKSLFAILDLIILKDIGSVPKDHSERFRILESKYSKLYSILDILYPFYRNTYINKVDKKTCEKVKENVKRIIKEQRIFENN